MTYWEIVENYLTTSGTTSFNTAGLAQDLGVSGAHASDLVQAYLAEQRRPTSRTQFALHRSGRTSAAVWHVGARAQDMRSMSRQHLDDMHCTVTRALAPDLERMGFINPRAAQVADALANVVVANVQLLAAQL
jgi:hypothetical protein